MAGSFKVYIDESGKVYIDESGDEGFKFDLGSSEWFVLSAVITRAEHDMEAVKLVDEVRSLISSKDRRGARPRAQLHFRDLKHHQRVPYVGRISSGRLRAISQPFQGHQARPGVQREETDFNAKTQRREGAKRRRGRMFSVALSSFCVFATSRLCVKF
jgi:hypothetical protein